MGIRQQRGFTLVELMVVVCIIGLLSAVAMPTFTKYIKKGKTAEARELIRKIYEGARAYYMDPALAGDTMDAAVAPPMFPAPTEPATPPLGTCCAAGGKCAASALYWKTPTWVSLQFSVDDSHYFLYAYETSGDPAAGNNVFTARAYGDLDCDGRLSTWSMHGSADVTLSDGPAGSGGISSIHPYE